MQVNLNKVLVAFLIVIVTIYLYSFTFVWHYTESFFKSIRRFQLSSCNDSSNLDKTKDLNLPDFSGAPISEGSMKIPKILHQTWKNRQTIPPKYVNYQKTWLDTHPSWKYHLWTDEENRELVRIHYPWLLKTYDEFPVDIMRADTSHYLQMHQYGGLYVDMDMEPLRPLDFLLDNATEPVTLAYMRDRYHDITNIQPGFMISVPGHPLWLYTLLRIITLVDHVPIDSRPDYVTGPVAFYHAISDYTAIHLHSEKKGVPTKDRKPKQLVSIKDGSKVIYGIEMLAPGRIYPYHWSQKKTDIGKICDGQNPTQNETACKAMFPKAYTIQYSSCSWCKEWNTFLTQYAVKQAEKTP